MANDGPSMTAAQQAALAALLETLVPASEELAMPSAAEVGFEAYLDAQARDFVPELLAFLERLDASFAGCAPGDRVAQLTQLAGADRARFGSLLSRVYDCYYQDDRVRERIGVVRGAAFPQGNEVIQGDLSLLDPVIENADRHRYREPRSAR